MSESNKPRKFLTAFMYFAKEHRDIVRNEYPSWNTLQIAKELERKWIVMSESEKDIYNQRYQEDHGRYNKELETYYLNKQILR